MIRKADIMAKTYTLTEVAELLDVDPKSLRRWIELEKWDLSEQTTKYDKRIKYLTEDQIKELAKLHERSWPPMPRPAGEQSQVEQGIPGAVKLLKDRVGKLEGNQLDPSATEIRLLSLEHELANIKHQYLDMLGRQTNLMLTVKELLDWKATQESKPKLGRKPKSTPAADTPEYQAGMAAVEGDD